MENYGFLQQQNLKHGCWFVLLNQVTRNIYKTCFKNVTDFSESWKCRRKWLSITFEWWRGRTDPLYVHPGLPRPLCLCCKRWWTNRYTMLTQIFVVSLSHPSCKTQRRGYSHRSWRSASASASHMSKGMKAWISLLENGNLAGDYTRLHYCQLRTSSEATVHTAQQKWWSRRVSSWSSWQICCVCLKLSCQW